MTRGLDSRLTTHVERKRCVARFHLTKARVLRTRITYLCVRAAIPSYAEVDFL